MAKYHISAALMEGGFRFDLSRSGVLGFGTRPVAFRDWTPDMHPGVSFLKMLADNEAATERDGGACVMHDTIACMALTERAVLGLPKPCPYSMRLESVGAVSDPIFTVCPTWITAEGTEVAGLRRSGTRLGSVADEFIVSEPLYSLLEEIERLNELGPLRDGMASLDARMVQFDRVKLALSTATGDAQADSYLASLTIHHATALAIEPVEASADLFQPVLFGNAPAPFASEENEEVAEVRRPLLPRDHALKFRSVLFPRQGARSHYRLAEGVYAVVDAPVEAALRVVARVNRSDPGTRAAFRANPRSFLNEEIKQAGGTGDIVCDGATIREVMDYGERVTGVQEWNGVRLSFKIPVYHKWFPDDEEAETYTLEVPGSERPLVVRPEQVSQLRDAIERARAAGQQVVSFEGRTIPWSSELEDTVASLVGLVSPERGGEKTSPTADAKKPGKLLVLHAAENEEDLVFNARMRDPTGALTGPDADPPLRTVPMPHQRDGIGWLRHAYISGMPGVLLADDMGLGKTYQVLAFLNWLRLRQAGERKPILIVAPKKLLDVWLDEVSGHIGGEGLGLPVLAYDENLKHLKVSVGKEGQLGRHVLDVDRLRAAGWVITTYETLRDYHFSFAAVRFRVAVYDEAQKMKSMASLINNAAKCQQADFTILMTGTPIENSIMDLWTLLDVAWPGFLGVSGKEFAKTFPDNAAAEKLAELKLKLIEPLAVGGRQCPPVMLRRFKSDILVGLPKKEERSWREVMPPEQTRAYDVAVAEQKNRKVHPLQALNALRTASFHPDLRMPAGPQDHAKLINASARFRALFRILDDVERANERALVFIDLRMGQRVLAELIRARYRLKRHPQTINGDTSTKALKQIKAEFQEGKGFDVLLLGPRAAGFGLTLTAANHVVHMNRWWNPAVEDQCSDRVYRMGQDKAVTIHVPIGVHPTLGERSFDVVLDSMLGGKRSLSREIVVPTTMTDQDFQRLFSTVISGQASGAGELDTIDRMGWRGFEDWTADQFARAGYQAHRTPRSGDAGADIVLRPPQRSPVRPIICQCKHRSLGEGAVDEQAIEEVMGAPSAYGRIYPWLSNPILIAVTNGDFSLAARSLAKEKGVTVVDRSEVVGLAKTAADLLV